MPSFDLVLKILKSASIKSTKPSGERTLRTNRGSTKPDKDLAISFGAANNLLWTNFAPSCDE